MFSHCCRRRLQLLPSSSSSGCINSSKALTSSCRRHNSTKPATASPITAEDVLKTGNDEEALPFLPRPLGLKEAPSTIVKTWKERTEELMDQDVRMAQRRHLVKEAAKGYYTDFNALKKFGGKTWVAPPSLIREDQALYFPNITGTALDSKKTVHTAELCRGKISVVGMLSTKISDEHVDAFVAPTNTLYLSNPDYQFVQLNIQENFMKAYLVSFYVSSLRSTIPPALQPTYLLSSQSMEYLREPLQMVNKHIGYVYLLDQNQKVRWAGGGMARAEEKESLAKCVGVLLGRMKKGKGEGEKV